MTSLTSAPSAAPDRRRESLGWLALALSVVLISWSSIFVRYADVGPVASAFWRMALALPPLWAWARLERRAAVPGTPAWGFATLAGFAFAADLITYHSALLATTVANASFIGNTASILTVIAGALFLKEKVRPVIWAALALALSGAWVMGGAAAGASGVGRGDIYAFLAAIAYSSYFVFVKLGQDRSGLSSAEVMWRSSLIAAILLLGAALWLEPRILPVSLNGWWPLIALGVLSHAGGQGLTAVALGRVPMAPLALGVLVQPVLTALAAFWVLHEGFSPLQGTGAAMILAAVAASRFR